MTKGAINLGSKRLRALSSRYERRSLPRKLAPLKDRQRRSRVPLDRVYGRANPTVH